MTPPTPAQQRGLAYAPLPSAFLSTLSCLYIIHHLLIRERSKLQRLYHRLVLAMNLALLLLSLVWIWAPFAVNEEYSKYFVAARGTEGTCTVSGE